MSNNPEDSGSVSSAEGAETQPELAAAPEVPETVQSPSAKADELQENDAGSNSENGVPDGKEEFEDLYDDKSGSGSEDKTDGVTEKEQPEDNNGSEDDNGEEDEKHSDDQEQEEEKDTESAAGVEESDGDEDEKESDGDKNEDESDDENSGQSDDEDEKEGGAVEKEGESEPASVQSTSTEGVALPYNEMVRKQADYILSSDMLNLGEFQELSSHDKVTAIVNMVNSNPETALPASDNSVVESTESNGFLEQRSRSRPGVEERRRPDLGRPMTSTERERYGMYLRGENKITEMHDIPPKSRLFIGNLPLKNVSKEELFRIFSPYGHILQINIKNAFGFIQYDNPQSVKTAISYESQEMNFGKKLILEISSSNARPQFDHGDHGTNSSSTFISSSKRPFHTDENNTADMYNDNQGYKKSKRRIPACFIYVKRTADRSYANEVFNHFRRGTGLETDMVFLKPRMELRRMINDAAYDGVWGVILVNKTRNVDIQIFYRGPHGETKFDEYISISSDDAIAIFNNLKTNRSNGAMSASSAPPPATLVSAPNPYAAPPPPQQSYYGGYGLTPPLAQQPPMAPQQQPYVQAAPSAYAPYGNPAAPYARYQPQIAQPLQPAPAPPPPPSAAQPHADPGQQQLLAAIQNLPPNIVSNLLAAAQQQQQQQQQPQTNQQLLGILQAMQPQPQQHHQQQFPSQQAPQQHFQQPTASLSSPPQHPHQPQPSAGNNVQSLLDSLAKLQK